MNVTISNRLILLCISASVPISTTAMAQDGPPPGPPIAEMAAQMNVSETALQTCMPRPAKGARPERPVRPDPSTIANCLHADYPDVTQTVVAQVLMDNAPKRPQRSN
ncbi:MAG: hypothetical protein ABJH45_22270 [Paracoccaceae bacterium]